MHPARPVRPARTARLTRPLSLALAACFGALAFTASAQVAPPGRTVESLLEIAREKNPEFAGMRFEAAAARERPESAGALPDPVLRIELMDITNASSNANPSLNPAKVGSTKYTVMQSLPWAGKRDAMRGAAEADVLGATSRAEVAWLEIATRIKTAYAQYFLAAEGERLTREMLDLMTRLEGVAQARYAGGLAPQQDAIRAQVEQTTMRTDLVMLESERRRISARLNAILARPVSAPLAEPERLRPLPPPVRLQPADLDERARARSPLIAAEAAKAQSAGKMVELANLERYPDILVGLSPTQSGNRVSDWGVMLEFSIPLRQDRRRAKEREAQSMLDAASAKKDAVANGVAGDLAENLVSLEAARRTEAITTSSLLPQAELTFQSALAGYENGKVDFATLLDAQRQIRRAKLERLKAQVEAQMRLADIERIVGEEL
jgi:outer membrane protein TolC